MIGTISINLIQIFYISYKNILQLAKTYSIHRGYKYIFNILGENPEGTQVSFAR
jgi:hypothetical protein